MRKIILVALLFASSSTHANVKPGTFGLGVGIGGISGLTWFYQMEDHQFVQGVFNMANMGERLAITADYAFSFPNAIDGLPNVRPYYGLGVVVEKFPRVYIMGRSVVRDRIYVGGRMPLGLQVFVPKTPLQISLEIAPGMYAVPSTIVFIDMLFSVRYLF